MKLFACRASKDFALKVAETLGLNLGASDVLTFSDGEFQPSFNESVRGATVFIIQSTPPPTDNLFELLLMIDAAKRASAGRMSTALGARSVRRQKDGNGINFVRPTRPSRRSARHSITATVPAASGSRTETGPGASIAGASRTGSCGRSASICTEIPAAPNGTTRRTGPARARSAQCRRVCCAVCSSIRTANGITPASG